MYTQPPVHLRWGQFAISQGVYSRSGLTPLEGYAFFDGVVETPTPPYPPIDIVCMLPEEADVEGREDCVTMYGPHSFSDDRWLLRVVMSPMAELKPGEYMPKATLACLCPAIADGLTALLPTLAEMRCMTDGGVIPPDEEVTAFAVDVAMSIREVYAQPTPHD